MLKQCIGSSYGRLLMNAHVEASMKRIISLLILILYFIGKAVDQTCLPICVDVVWKKSFVVVCWQLSNYNLIQFKHQKY